jgi:signal transduction histidine kinase
MSEVSARQADESAGRPASRPRLAGDIRMATVGVAAASVLVVFAVFFSAWAWFSISQATQELSVRTSAVAKGLTGSGRLSSDSGIRDRLFHVEADLIGATLFVTDADGAVLFSSSPAATRVRLPVRQLTSQGDVLTGLRGVPGFGSSVMVAAPVSEVNGSPGARWVVALQPLRDLNRSRAWAWWVLAGCALLAVLVAWIAGGLLARRIAAPIVRLQDATRAVSAGDWGHQVSEEGPAEVASLAGSFNAMSSRVADTYEAQRDFVGDVSHELRTPITSIQGFSGALLDGTVTDPEDQHRYLGVIRDEAERLSELTRSLLALAELDSGQVTLAVGPVDPSALAEALSARYGTIADEHGIRFETAALSGRPLADPDRLLQSVSTLVDNALAHTPEGGTVRVAQAPAAAGRWAVAVDDTGPGIPPERREQVFGRFSRLDPSRATHSGGSGLGLAICRRTVELMGGTVTAEDGELRGARFVIDLPAVAVR